jgi:hypothetical protein
VVERGELGRGEQAVCDGEEGLELANGPELCRRFTEAAFGRSLSFGQAILRLSG